MRRLLSDALARLATAAGDGSVHLHVLAHRIEATGRHLERLEDRLWLWQERLNDQATSSPLDLPLDRTLAAITRAFDVAIDEGLARAVRVLFPPQAEPPSTSTWVAGWND